MRKFSEGAMLLALTLAAIGFGQTPDEDHLKGTRRNVAGSNDPVTRAEANAVFKKVDASVRSALGLPSATFKPIAGTGLVQRAEILAVFQQWRKVSADKVQVRPRPVPYDAHALAVADPLLKEMVRDGYVSKTGDLARNAKGVITPTEFGDAIGLFLARLAEVTHTPSTRFTPYLRSKDSDL